LMKIPASGNWVVTYECDLERMWSSPGEFGIVRLELGLTHSLAV